MIFAATLVLLVIAIAITVFVKSDPLSHYDLELRATFANDASTTYSASGGSPSVDHNSNIERLRALLAKDDTQLSQSPSVETISAPEPEIKDDENKDEVKLERCSGGDDSALVSHSWPLKDVFVIVKDNTRSVVKISKTDAPQELQNATTSAQASSTQQVEIAPLLVMKAFPEVLGQTSCVPSDIIGVTKEGSLLFNSDAISYRTVGKDDLIGYARDGFPIYGTYEGETDPCGGYHDPHGYRYSLSMKRNFIIGCFAGSPATFNP